MKNSKKILLGAAVIFAIAVAIYLVIMNPIGKRPFKNININDIDAATVTLTPPGVMIQIVDIQELMDYLDDVVIYKKDESYTEYDGQGIEIILTLSDGSLTTINAYNPFIIIDGIAYRTKYEPCEELSAYANSLMKKN